MSDADKERLRCWSLFWSSQARRVLVVGQIKPHIEAALGCSVSLSSVRGSQARTLEAALWTSIVLLLEWFGLDECKNYIRHCSY